MPIPEPGDALWAQVSQYTTWPDSDEDAVRAMSAGWRGGGEHFTRASAFDLGPVAGGWTDQAGQAFHGRTTGHLQAAGATGARMTEMAARADAFAAEVTGVKNGIHALMAANQQGFAQTAALPAEMGAAFVQEIAVMVDRMKAEAAARISAAAPAAPATAQFAQGQAPAGPPPGGDPQAVADWWNDLGDPGRAYWKARPEEIGALDGVPAADRSEANLAILREKIASLERLEAHAPGAAATAPRLDALRELESRFDPDQKGGLDELFLLGFDNEGDGKAIVSVGNPDTAKNVATLVPGIDNDISDVSDQINRANSLRADPDNAAIVWLDYNTPESPAAVSLTGTNEYRAEAAKADFSRFQAGLRATHIGEPSFNTVVAHSYGGTVAGLAAASEEGLNADRLVLVAPTDPGADRATDYHLLTADGTRLTPDEVRQRVFATGAADDTTAAIANELAGRHPLSEEFGAQTFYTQVGAADPHSGAPWQGRTLLQIQGLVDGGTLS